MKLSKIERELAAAAREDMGGDSTATDHRTWLRIARASMGHVARDTAKTHLVITTPDGTRDVLLEKDEVLLGSDASCSVHLPYRLVSHRHCLLRNTGDQWMLVDLGSTNGTLVNGVLCPEKALVAGDILQIGEATILYLPPLDDLGIAPPARIQDPRPE